MSTPVPVSVVPIDSLKARLLALAQDPRVRLVPDGRVIVLEIRAVLVLVELYGEQLASLELVHRLRRVLRRSHDALAIPKAAQRQLHLDLRPC